MLEVIEFLDKTEFSREEIENITNVSVGIITQINLGNHTHCPKDRSYPIRKNKRQSKNYSLEDIKQIHKMLLDPNYSTADIANMYHCSRDLISDINTGKRYVLKNIQYPIRTFYPKRKSKK